jgi:hypothetical protein
MPSSTPKQARFMQAVAHNPKFAKKAGVPQKVGKDFAAADRVSKKPPKRPATVTAQTTDGGIGSGRMSFTTPAKGARLPKAPPPPGMKR